MSEEVLITTIKEWRDPCKQTRGRRKGQFMKSSVVLKRGQLHAKKRLCKDSAEEDPNDILSGRELVEPKILAKEIWCTTCKIPLSFELTIERVQRGLATIYHIKCCKCAKVKVVHTSAPLPENLNLFTVNAKAAMGILDAGIGESQFNSLLSSMNIAPAPATLLKRYKRIVGQAVEAVAMESCSRSLEDEKYLTRSMNDVMNDE